MPAGYPEYPGPEDAETGETYTYETADGESVAATVAEKNVGEDGSISVTLHYEGDSS